MKPRLFIIVPAMLLLQTAFAYAASTGCHDDPDLDEPYTSRNAVLDELTFAAWPNTANGFCAVEGIDDPVFAPDGGGDGGNSD